MIKSLIKTFMKIIIKLLPTCGARKQKKKKRIRFEAIECKKFRKKCFSPTCMY